MLKRKLWFSVTGKDCRFQAKRGGGKGGQAKNKTSNAIQCFHDPSGAMGESEDGRSQLHNKRTAFIRMTETAEFKSWLLLKIEAGKGNVEITEADDRGSVAKRKIGLDEI